MESQLCKAIKSHDEETVARILCHSQDVNPNQFIPSQSMTILHLAVGLSNNRPEIVERLMQRGGNPNNMNIEENLSPLHLSVIYDYDKVAGILMRDGGDPMLLSGDGQNCYDIANQNLEEEMLDKCFLFFYKKLTSFRKSVKPSDNVATALKKIPISTLSDLSGDQVFFSCESDIDSSSEDSLRCTKDPMNRLLLEKVSYLMTEDESNNDGRLSTIAEESAVITPRQREYCFYRSIEDTSKSAMSSDSDPSCINSTPPLIPEPTKNELLQLQETMKNLKIPVTPSTYGVLNKYAGKESKLSQVLSPKPGTHNFTSELKMSIQNLQLIVEWGNLKLELIQNSSPTSKTSKSFYNYLLLDPKIIKKANFSGNHLKSGVINNSEKFETFLRSIFYIGKGCGRRPIQHLVDAKATLLSSRKSQSSGEKIDKILEIWKSGLGVIIVSIFHHSSEREANVNEAAMIDAIGLVELSNIKKGSYGGTIATQWSQKAKNQLGSFLLHKSFCSFAVGDHKAFYPKDI